MSHPSNQLLWQLTHPDFPDRISYLFGTMHVRDARAFNRIHDLYACIQACDAFAAELDLADPAAAQLGQVLTLPPSEWLDQHLSSKRFERICRIAQKAFGIDLNRMRLLHPMLLQQLLSESLLSSDYQEALDSHLFHYAIQAEKHCFGLESWEEQLRTLERMDLADLRRNFLGILRNVSAFRRHHEKLVTLYTSGQIQQLYQQVRRSSGSARRLLIYIRNERMTERIVEQHQQQPTFFAIGAGHLAGGKGVLRGLKHQGFHLQPGFSETVISLPLPPDGNSTNTDRTEP